MTTPAVQVRSFAVTIPAGTAIDSPYTESVSFPAMVVDGVHWMVPPGPSGLMGWRLSMSGGVAVIPTGGGWIIADDESSTWSLTDQPDSGAWEITGYNTDIYDHTVYVDFLLSLVTAPAAAVASPSLASLSSLASSTAAGITAG